MADDWQPGDLAVLVVPGEVRCACGRIYEGLHCPPVGVPVIVSQVARCDDYDEPGVLYDEPCSAPVLNFANGLGGHHYRFRKIRPHTPDAEDAETIRLLTGAPVREPVA